MYKENLQLEITIKKSEITKKTIFTNHENILYARRKSSQSLNKIQLDSEKVPIHNINSTWKP